MKIAIITTSFPRWQGDYMGVFVYEAARAVQRQGNQVRVISMHNPGSKVRENWDGIEIIRTRYLPEKWEMLQSQGGGMPEVWKNKPWVRFQIIPFILAHFFTVWMNTQDCDLFHANWTLSGAIAWMMHFITRKPYVVTVQGSDIFKATRLPLMPAITKVVLKGAKRVLTLSNSLADHVCQLGVPKEQIEIIPNGVDSNSFVPLPLEEREENIIFVGSLIDRKGVSFLIRAFRDVVQEHPNVSLIIIGEGPQRKEYEDLAQQLRVSEKVKFAGSQTQKEVAAWLQRSKLFVLPSKEEGLGVVLLEALACGTPIVGTEVGGIPDVVIQEVGKLVPPADPKSLKEAICCFLRMSPQEWTLYHQHARSRAVNVYDWNKVAEKIVSTYRN